MNPYVEGISHRRQETRLGALNAIVNGFCQSMQVSFAEKNFTTLVYHSRALLKKGTTQEISLATQAIALCAITLGDGDDAHEMYQDSLRPLSLALELNSESLKISSILDCLAVVTFIGAVDFEEIEETLQVIWKLVQKMALDVNAREHSSSILAAAISAWAFVLTKVETWRLNYKYCHGTISVLSDLLEDDNESVYIAALEALALISGLGFFNRFRSEAECSSIQEMKDNIVSRVMRISLKEDDVDNDLKNDLAKVIEDRCHPKTILMDYKPKLKSLSSHQMLPFFQMKFIKRILGKGFNTHVKGNEYLHELFYSIEVKKNPVDPLASQCQMYELDTTEVVGGYYECELRSSDSAQRKFKSPNSFRSKARTKLRNKQRRIAEEKHYGNSIYGD